MTRTNINILTIAILLFCGSLSSQAQPFGNEWIKSGQNYYKFSISETGVYRIFYSTLESAGIIAENPNFNPRRLQIFRRGVEQAITINDDNNNGVFDQNEFIEFYAEKNDGSEDSALYINPNDQPHRYQNLFADEATYFLTFQLGAPTAKRIEPFFESNVTNIPADQFYTERKVITFNTEYTEGMRYSGGSIKLSQYDMGEGWTDARFRAGQSKTYSFSGLEFKNDAGITPQLTFMITGKNANAKSVDILVGPDVNNLRSINTTSFSGYASVRKTLDVAYSDISTSGVLIVRFTMATNERNIPMDAAISYLEFDYSRNFSYSDAEDHVIKLNPNAANKSFFTSTSTSTPNGILDITDKNNPISIGFEQNSGQFNVVVNNTNTERQLYWYSTKAFIGNMEKVSFGSIDPAGINYLMITSKRLMVDPSAVNDYKDYRESSSGGSFNIDLRNIEDLYNLFNYGDESPVAIRRYCDFMLKGGDPKFLFLMGRGIIPQQAYRRNNPAKEKNFVPTFGFPGADVPFTAGLGATRYEDAIPTGRLNAESTVEINNYLNKVKEAESAPITDLRRKQLLHLSGGNTSREQSDFQRFVNEFQTIAENTLLGGQISKKAKATVDPVELSNINEEINKGIALTTFFGHSSSSAADIDVGLVSRPEDGYTNKGKYGFFLVNGCNAGDFYTSGGFSFGDDRINTANLGIVGFIAHSDVGFSSQLRLYSNSFYDAAFRDPSTFGSSIGEIRQLAIQKFLGNSSNPTEAKISQAQQMVYLGDPALKLFPTSKSEYEITSEDISFSAFDQPQLLSTADSFSIQLDIKNYGRFDVDSVELQIKRTLVDGSMINYPLFLIPPVANQQTIDLTLSNTGTNDLSGNNTFVITIDPNDSLSEDNIVNNVASAEVFFARGSTSNIFPSNLSIVDSTSIRIVSHPTDLMTNGRSILIEIDDNMNFTSPLTFTEVASPVVNKQIDLNDIVNNIADSTVIFWRTRLSSPAPNESNEWNTNSFTYIENTIGWGQLRPSQYAELNTDGLTFKSNLWEFEKIISNLDVTTNGSAIPNLDSVVMKFEGADLYSEADGGDNPTSATDNCRANTLNFVVFDKRTTTVLRPVLIDGKEVEFNEPRKCGKSPQSIYSFNNTELQAGDQNILNLFDAVKTGAYVLVFSVDSVDYNSIDTDVLDQLNNLGLGANTLSNLSTGESSIFLGKKDSNIGSAIEIRGNNSNSDISLQKISLNAQIEGNINDGTINSPVLGPASGWGRLNTNFNTLANDINSIKVIGISIDGNDSILFEQSSFTDFDLSSVDAKQFPRLKLSSAVSDEVNFTPPAFEWWTVTYQQVPEGILVLRESSSSRTKETQLEREEGQEITQGFTFLNVSEQAFSDSISVKHELKSKSSGNTSIKQIQIAPLTGNSSVDFDINISTIGNTGINSLKVLANDQNIIEESFGNNSVSIDNYVEVIGDVTNPLLDVTFDGQQIFNNDIVSPNPSILINIKDDNTLLPKTDTTGINVFIKQNCEECTDFSRISFDDPKISWTAGDSEKGFEARYLPGPLENGIYTLRVQGTDQSGNRIGSQPYEISFEVINESMISNFYPYPNPFSTSTRFVFTLTGSEIPDDLKIQIMTISGRVVREIFLEELGSIRIGNNISDFAWNGKDQYGDQLANGVYLYRVMIKNPGENFKAFTTSGDKAFKKGFGKMYLLR